MGGLGVPKLATTINNSSTIQKILKGVNKNPAVFSAGAAFLIASGLRPTLIGMCNFKDKKDKKTSQASAIAAGLVELLLSVGVFIPLNKFIESSSKFLYEQKNSVYFQNKDILRQYKSLTNRGAKLALLPIISFARFALVKPITEMFDKKNKTRGLNKWG